MRTRPSRKKIHSALVDRGYLNPLSQSISEKLVAAVEILALAPSHPLMHAIEDLRLSQRYG